MGFEIDFKGKTVIVSGGSRGIGAAMCEQFASAGANVAVLYHTDPNAAAAVAWSLEEKYPEVKTQTYYYAAQEVASAAKVVDAVIADFGVETLASVVCNAGIAQHVPVVDATEADYNSIMDVNVKGPYFLAQAAARVWIKNKQQGTIIMTASMSGQIVNEPQTQALYNISKAGVVMMAKSLAAEWAPHGIRVNSVSPGYIATEMLAQIDKERTDYWKNKTPVGRFGKPEEVGKLTVFLASDKSTFMTGTNVAIDGGYTLW